MAKDETKYPGWPNNVIWPPLEEWMTVVKEVPMGQGLMGSNVGGPLFPDRPPHPEYVKQWRERKNGTVSETAQFFDLSDVQVLQACR